MDPITAAMAALPVYLAGKAAEGRANRIKKGEFELRNQVDQDGVFFTRSTAAMQSADVPSVPPVPVGVAVDNEIAAILEGARAALRESEDYAQKRDANIRNQKLRTMLFQPSAAGGGDVRAEGRDLSQRGPAPRSRQGGRRAPTAAEWAPTGGRRAPTAGEWAPTGGRRAPPGGRWAPAEAKPGGRRAPRGGGGRRLSGPVYWLGVLAVFRAALLASGEAGLAEGADPRVGLSRRHFARDVAVGALAVGVLQLAGAFGPGELEGAIVATAGGFLLSAAALFAGRNPVGPDPGPRELAVRRALAAAGVVGAWGAWVTAGP